MTEPQLELDLVQFTAEGRSTGFSLDLAAETLWATAADIADLFRTSNTAVVRQIAAVYAEGELDPATTRRTLPAAGGAGAGTTTDHYDLDVILSVGYRINAAKATAFRRWSSRMLRTLLVEGFVLDRARLDGDATARDTLAERLRAIRTSEANLYDSVRRAFAEGAADYRSDSPAAQSFSRLLEDKVVFAVTGKSSPALILERADHDAPDMGLQGFHGALPSMDEARIAQNYLGAHELFLVHVLCEQFLLLMQQRAARGQPMTMAGLTASLDALLRAEDYPVLQRHKDAHAARAIRHAQAEYARYVLGRRPPPGQKAAFSSAR